MFMIHCIECGKLYDASGALDDRFAPCEHVLRQDEQSKTN